MQDDTLSVELEAKALECWRAIMDVRPLICGDEEWLRVKAGVPPLRSVACVAWKARKRAADRAFSKFCEETKHIWRSIAHDILRRWKAPTCVDDILQEMRIGLWRFFAKYDETRGITLFRYLRWNATILGRRWSDAERGASKHGSRNKNPSRHALPFSSFVRDGQDDDGSRQFEIPQEAVQDRVADVRMIVQRCRTAQDRLIVETLMSAGGSIEVVVDYLFDGMDQKVASELVYCTLLDLGFDLAKFEQQGAA